MSATRRATGARCRRWSARTAAAPLDDPRLRAHASPWSARSCLTVLDAKDPNCRSSSKFEDRSSEWSPRIPLGTRGKLRGDGTKSIGFQVRTIVRRRHAVQLARISPVQSLQGISLPDRIQRPLELRDALQACRGHDQRTHRSPRCIGETVHAFPDTRRPHTTFVLGEFPWHVQVGERST